MTNTFRSFSFSELINTAGLGPDNSVGRDTFTIKLPFDTMRGVSTGRFQFFCDNYELHYSYSYRSNSCRRPIRITLLFRRT